MGAVKERVQFLFCSLFPESDLYRVGTILRSDACEGVCFGECFEGRFGFVFRRDGLFHIRVLYTVHRGKLVRKECLIFPYHYSLSLF